MIIFDYLQIIDVSDFDILKKSSDYGLGEFRNTKVGDLNWLSAFSHYTRLWDTPQKIQTSSFMGEPPASSPGNTKEILKNTKEITPLAVLNFFPFKLNILTTLGLWVWFYRS